MGTKPKIFVNLPVKDLTRSKEYFTKIGYELNPKYTDDKGACVVVSDDIFVMLLDTEFFKTWTPKTIADAKTNTETMVALSFDKKDGVDKIAKKAVDAGGKVFKEVDEKGMYQRSVEDLDGHIWEYFWMDETLAGATPPPT
jgi:uncharacterized protein